MIVMVPLRRLGTRDEVVNAVVWLASDEARYLTSVNLEITGGICIALTRRTPPRSLVSDAFIGIDVGTSACKVSVVGADATILASSSHAYPTQRAHAHWAEQDPLDWWGAARAGIRDVVAAAPAEIVGIGVAGQGWSALLVDDQGEPLHPALIWQDRRAAEACATLEHTVPADDILARAGNRVDPAYVTPKLVWLREHLPAVAAAAHTALQSNGFIVQRLTGTLSHDVSQGYGHANFDIGSGTWNHEWTRAFGLPEGWFPRLYRCSEVVGGLLPAVAADLGLRGGIPVVAGGLDAAAGSLAAGVVSVGQTQEQGGQAGGMSIVVDEPRAVSSLILSFHVVDDVWLLQGGTTGGGALRWLQSLLPSDGAPYPFERLTEEAASTPPGADGLVFLPYLAGERSPLWDSDARGAFLGLTYGSDRGRLARAVMEGCAFALRHNLEVAAENGAGVHELRSVGGAASSSVWTQIKADVTGVPISVPPARYDTAFGAATLAAIGIGAWSSDRDHLSALVDTERRHLPDTSRADVYDATYAVYRNLYPALASDMRRLASLGGAR